MSTATHARRGVSALTAVALCGFLAAPQAQASTLPPVPVDLPAAVQDVASTSLSWGVRESFRNYIQGPIARGQWTTEGVTESGGAFTWASATGSADPEESTGSVSYTGAVHFTGHEGHFEAGEPALSVELSNPTVEWSGTSGTLYLDVESVDLDQNSISYTQVDFADLEFSNGFTVADDTLTGTAEAHLTAAGAEAFAGFYNAGEALDPVSISVALLPAQDAEPEPTPTETPTETPDPSDTPEPTETASPTTAPTPSPTATQTPTQSATPSATATPSASPSATATPRASASATPTPVFVSSPTSSPETSADETDPAPVSAAEDELEETYTETVCTAYEISGGTLSWGLRESFRSYIQGGIARGDWTLNGISYSGGAYQWGGGTGSFNTENGTGAASFGGGVHFTGHNGVLDFHMSNPRIEVTGPNSAVLYVDAVSDDMDGVTHNLPGVAFATISGPISTSGGTVSASGAAVNLTAEGAVAFAGFYEAGEPLDPISFTLPLGAETNCEEITYDADGNVVSSTGGSGGTVAGGAGTGLGTGGASLAATGTTVTAFGIASLVLVLLGLALMAARRKQA
ncbi:HtaA domain-containing protein [Nesterenkonia flava]|uniref:HtaA domain-containing protein n=1 Tax=Nesterenkonia flava TaxID=469799 RepID=A0ABU1FV71_9MICC|nr:HtaA domain-containing protein [Nesterenkonia flava]MDR5712162.1 HtaA domain-containing protein [Nesterenkonia flava]